jgi:hypothetical protein
MLRYLTKIAKSAYSNYGRAPLYCINSKTSKKKLDTMLKEKLHMTSTIGKLEYRSVSHIDCCVMTKEDVTKTSNQIQDTLYSEMLEDINNGLVSRSFVKSLKSVHDYFTINSAVIECSCDCSWETKKKRYYMNSDTRIPIS